MRLYHIIAAIVMVVGPPAASTLVAQQMRWPDLQAHAATPFDEELVRIDDERRSEAGELDLYARLLELHLTTLEDGTWTSEGADEVCRLRVASTGAEAIELLMEDVHVPQGATIQFFALDGRQLSDAMALDGAEGIMEYSSPMVHADEAVLEYRQPADASFQGRFTINGLDHAYRFVEDIMREEACHVNVACHPESNGWEDVIRATVRISVVTPQGNGWCTGTLVNNVRQDCAPYILSAFHCGRTSTAPQFNQYKFYFNFQYATCSGGSYSTAQFMTGAQRVAYSDDYAPQYQGVGGSDFMLMRTNAVVPDAYDPYWAGWDATSISSVTEDGVCIHHPTGAPKRISSYTQTLTTGHPMTSSGLLSHYRAKWAATTNGFGITEVGSSGSGLFKPHATNGPVLIGTLTGSSSGMTCANNTGTSYFGKMSYHWVNNPNTAALKLKNWLDPDATGTLVLAGSAHPCGAVASVTSMTTPEVLGAWPNPASTILNISHTSTGVAAVSMTDVAGHLVKYWRIDASTRTLDIQDLPNGVYALTLTTVQNEAPLRTKVVVQH